jgi:hypothetical protein
VVLKSEAAMPITEVNHPRTAELLAKIDSRFNALEATLIRWLIGTTIVIIGTVIACAGVALAIARVMFGGKVP